MLDRYYLVKFQVAGYEVSVLMSGSEQCVVQTIQKNISGPIYLASVSQSVAYALQNDFGMKVYECISNEVEETVITQVVDPVEDPDFQTNT